MKRILIVLIVCLLALPMAGGAFAETGKSPKIVFVDLQRAMNECEVGKNVRLELESFVRSRKAAIDAKIEKKDALKSELDRQSVTLSDDILQKKINELDALEKDIKRMIDDSDEELQKLQREKEVNILRSLHEVIVKLSGEKGYEIVLPIDVIIHAEESLEITDTVIKLFDAAQAAPSAEKSGAKKK